MKFFFLVEDAYGILFFSKFFTKKMTEGIFSGKLARIRRCPPGSKMTRLISTDKRKIDRVIIITDADGKDLEKKRQEVFSFVDKNDVERVRVVLLDREIEEWICYSENISSSNQKPSSVLKHHKNYAKRQLPDYADRLDCRKLQNCDSFKRFVTSLKFKSN